MIITESTIGYDAGKIRKAIVAALNFIRKRIEAECYVWIHVEKERREIIVNTDDSPLLPGQTTYAEYDEGGINIAKYVLSPIKTLAKIWAELKLIELP